jgi:hypothetical protein
MFKLQKGVYCALMDSGQTPPSMTEKFQETLLAAVPSFRSDKKLQVSGSEVNDDFVLYDISDVSVF